MRPPIICLSEDDADIFDWMSDGWYQEHQRGTPEAEALFAKARDCIESGDNVLDVIARLERAGFEVVRR
jgi:hypothetical protein